MCDKQRYSKRQANEILKAIRRQKFGHKHIPKRKYLCEDGCGKGVYHLTEETKAYRIRRPNGFLKLKKMKDIDQKVYQFIDEHFFELL